MKSSAVVTVLVSVILSIGLFTLLQVDPEPARAARGERWALADREALESLEARIARIEEAVRELREGRLEIPSTPASVPYERTAVATSLELDDDELGDRIAALEARLGAVEYGLGDAPSPAERAELEAQRERQRMEAIRNAKETLLDPNASVAEMLAAHQALRRVPDAYTPEMVEDLVYLGTNDPEPQVRADVWRFFDGSTHLPELVPHLKNALASDPDPRARAEAAETLGNYAEDEAVLAALRHAIEHDENPEVRRKLARVLAEWTAWFARER